MAYQIIATNIPDVLVLKPQLFGDARGFFMESFNQREFEKATGAKYSFIQDNHSRSVRGVLRGLHFQVEKPQGKLVRVAAGEVLDVVVDLRTNSPARGQWTAQRLSVENQLQMWVPPGFAHGFLVLSESADFLYKTTEYWHPELERSLAWNDPDLNIAWPLEELNTPQPILATKDAQAGSWADYVKNNQK
ncbi:MAG: dTDP-4-dehydrorhamnose 3,5-epimerase [Alphaproteobacteria bacterium]|nr:dTDP-4-dehydrorhamnose 3,5-epimerase [Alphaproteobacteria bacterium]MDI9329891.1 dTDP-4-dehydrorhamnose 3,5-epimerase [Alphaproteobacteria bacterium]